MAKNLKEEINKLITRVKLISAHEFDIFLETYGSPEDIEYILGFYEQHKISSNNRTDGLSERRRLHGLIGAILKSGLCRANGSSILQWVATYGDAWESLAYVDLLVNEDFEKFGEEESSVLHLLFSREDIDFYSDMFLIKRIIQYNLGLFFKPNNNNISAYQIFKNNKAIPRDLLQSHYAVTNFFEDEDGLNDMGLSGQWQRRWETFLSIADDEMIQRLLNENVALSIGINDGSITLFEEIDHSVSIDSLVKQFKKMHKTKYKRRKHSELCNKMVEQSLIYMANLLADDTQDNEEKKKRILHVEDALMRGYFQNENTIADLKDRLVTILKENPDINQANLKKVVASIENRFSKKYEEISKTLRKYALISTVLSVLLIGIPFAIYFWLQYKKSWQEAPVHIFHMPASTYKNLVQHFNRDDPNPEIKVMSEKGNIKRTVQLLNDPQTPYFEVENIPNKTKLKVVCQAGQQTKAFQEKIQDLPLLERFTVTNVL